MGASTFAKPMQWLIDYLGGGSRVKVNATTTLQTAPFWYGINKISGNVGSLPLNVMQRIEPKGSEKAKTHPAYGLLRKRPNRFQTPFVFKQKLTKDAIVYGNGRAYIRRKTNGEPFELIPLAPDRTLTGIVDGEKCHLTYLGDPQQPIESVSELMDSMNTSPAKTVGMKDADVLHIQGFGDGITGMSLFEAAKYSLEISLGADRRAARQMVKGFTGKVMLEAPENSPRFKNQEDAEEFMANFKDKHESDMSGEEVGLLLGGIKANVLQMSNKDAEFIEQRKYQRQEAALWLMLESILGDDNSVSYNSEEQKQLAYLKNCLSNWLIRWEQESEFKLLTPQQHMSDAFYCKFNTAALLKTDFPTTVETLAKAVSHRIMSPNECRDRIDMNPYDGGDEYENPAITPGTPGDTSTNDNTEEMAAKVRHMLGIEEKRVSGFLAKNHSISRIEEWYDSWATRLGDAIGDFPAAQAHCVRSLHYLRTHAPEKLDLTGSDELILKDLK